MPELSEKNAMDRSIRKAQYFIVEFVETGTSGIISEKWLQGKEHCLWSTNSKSRKTVYMAAENRTLPAPNWSLLEIRTLVHTESFEKAKKKENKSTYTSDLATTSAAEETEIGKRSSRPAKRYIKSDDDGEDYRIVQKKAENKNNVKMAYPKPPKPLQVSCSTSSSSPSAVVSKRSSFSSVPVFTTPLSALSASSSNTPITARDQWIVASLRELHAKVDTLSHMIQTQCGGLNQSTPALPSEVSLPLASMSEVKHLEELLSNVTVRNELIAYLGATGGGSETEVVARILSQVLSTPVARQLNWSGSKGKDSFSSLQLCSVVYESVRRNILIRHISKYSFQIITAKWFTGARDRQGGHSERMTKTKAKREAESTMKPNRFIVSESDSDVESD